VRAIFEQIAKERKRQDEKWGVQNHHSEKWFTILGEETGEACKASLERDWEGYRQELVESAAVIVAAIECFDRMKEGGTPQ